MYFKMPFLGMFFLNRINNIQWTNAGTIFLALYLPVTLWFLIH